MAEKTKTKTAGRRGSALDLPMAALAGGSVGFFAFAMPDELFERLIGATGLPSLLPAAQPPLGDTARLGFVAIAALTSFMLTWLLLRAIDKAPAAPAKEVEAEVPIDPPRLRRADQHPDAPARHPLRAKTDFGIPFDAVPQDERGEPVDVSVVENVDFEAEWERPAPSFLQPAAEQSPSEDELLLDNEDEGEPTSDETYEAVTEAEPGQTYEPVAEAEPVEAPFWLPEGAQEHAEEEAEPASEQVFEGHAAENNTILPFWAQQAEADTGADQPTSAEPSLDQLSTRLEGGLIRRKRDGRATRPRGHRGMDDRLRGALDDLTKMTGRG